MFGWWFNYFQHHNIAAVFPLNCISCLMVFEFKVLMYAGIPHILWLNSVGHQFLYKCLCGTKDYIAVLQWIHLNKCINRIKSQFLADAVVACTVVVSPPPPFSPRLCCQSASLQSWPAHSRPALSPGTSTLPPSSLEQVLPQWVWPAQELESEQCSAASSLAMPGKLLTLNPFG